jgi:hypothetical protein
MSAAPAPVPVAPPVPPQVALPFALYEALNTQQARVEHLRAHEPSVAEAMMRLGSTMVSLASRGRVTELAELVSATPQECILYWFTKKMLQAACSHGHVDVVRLTTVSMRLSAGCVGTTHGCLTLFLLPLPGCAPLVSGAH